MTLKVASDKKYIELEEAVVSVFEAQENFVYNVTPVSVYQGEDKTSKNISFHISFSSTEKTLEANEISDIMEKVEKRQKYKKCS